MRGNEALLQAAAVCSVGKPGGGSGGAGASETGALSCNERGKVVAGALDAAMVLGSARFKGADVLDCWSKVAGTRACCCEPKWLLLAASDIAEIGGPKWPSVELELGSELGECIATVGGSKIFQLGN